ncbi:MAG: caspase family protein [Gemmataceae bacterium]
MSRLVQSSCPGCKNRLRIPAEWLDKSIRCKHCGLVLQAKQAAASPRNPAAPPDAAPAIPVALPVPQPLSGSPFADLRGEEEAVLRRRRRQRKSQGGWMGPTLALAVFVIAGFVVYLNWERLAALLPTDDEPLAQNNRDNGAVKETPANANNGRDNSPINRPRPGSNMFPRRALIISIHDYLYANPLQNGMAEPQAANFNNLINSLNVGLHVPLTQVAHLSDDAGPKWGKRAPTKTVIEKTLTNFLDSSRPQDRILVFFVGHAVELGDDVYLAPIEGELDKAETLIPLKWVYEQLAKCKARQKVLVLDGNRFNQTFGQERPGGEAMGPKLDAMLQAPPAGVQVWSSCSAKQRSFASDDYPMGIFLDALQTALHQGGRGKIQKAEQALPLEHYVDLVNKLMKDDLRRRKLEQVSRLSGKEAETGAAYDPKERLAPNAATVLASPPAGVEKNKMLVESVLEQIGTPPVKVTHEMALSYDALPPFSAEALKKYEGDQPNADSPLRKAVQHARAALWAIYPGQEPKELSGEVSILRQQIGAQLNVLKEGYRAPPGVNAEKQFKEGVENDERKVARLLRGIEDALNELRDPKVVEARGTESKRWQANYDLILARVQLEYAYLFEYQSMLGSMRKEFPPRDPQLHGGWKLASKFALEGDREGQKLAREARQLLDKIIKNNASSPWEVLAKREKLTNLGLEWQPAK